MEDTLFLHLFALAKIQTLSGIDAETNSAWLNIGVKKCKNWDKSARTVRQISTL